MSWLKKADIRFDKSGFSLISKIKRLLMGPRWLEERQAEFLAEDKL